MIVVKRKAATMQDIALQIGISVNAVSLALKNRPGVSEETRRRVQEVAQQIGYKPKQTQPAPETPEPRKSICVLLLDRFFRDFRFYGRILLGIEETAKQAGYEVQISSFSTLGEETVPASVQEHRVAGLIVLGMIRDSFLARLLETDVPLVLADHQSSRYAVDCVLSDNYFGAYRMAMYLFQKGYTKIGFFGDREYTPSTRDRYFGVLKAVNDHVCPGNMKEAMDYLERFSTCGKIEKYAVEQNAQRIFELYQEIPDKPDALICSNDELAILLMQTLQKNDISVPGDVAITGYDDIETSGMMAPALTTIHVQKRLMGQRAVECLLRRLEHPHDLPEKRTISVTLVERESV